ncbi:MAG: hypothetical protein Q9190_002040 [Brigantiaea leucoxantha]
MSLHRVSSMSSYEHVRGSSPARGEHRKMSFNPVGTWVPPAAKEEPVGAYEVSKAKRIAGIVFGYAALKPVLIEEGVYSESCATEYRIKGETCYEQEIRAIFLFYRLIYTASGRAFTPQKFFLVYLVVPIFIFIVQCSLMPKNSYKTVGELVKHAQNPANDIDATDQDVEDEDQLVHIREERRAHRQEVVSEVTSLLGRKGEQGDKQQQQEARKKQISGVWGALHGYSAVQQIKSPWFILITLFTVVQMTRINFFVATIRPQYEYLLQSHESAVRVNNFFDVALPLGGVASIPFIGLILDNTSTPFVLSTLVVLATVIGILGVIPSIGAAYTNILLFVLYRPFYYTAVSDYAAKVFGFHTFGKVYGLIICLAGLLNFSQSALDALMHKQFKGDPVLVNILLLLVALLVGLILVGYVYRKSRSMARENLEEEAEEATENFFPNGNG